MILDLILNVYVLFFLIIAIVSVFSILVISSSQTHMYVCKYLHVQITVMQIFSPECKSVMRLMPSSKASGVWHSDAWLGIEYSSTILKKSSPLIIDQVPERQRLHSSWGSFEIIPVKAEAWGKTPLRFTSLYADSWNKLKRNTRHLRWQHLTLNTGSWSLKSNGKHVQRAYCVIPPFRLVGLFHPYNILTGVFA